MKNVGLKLLVGVVNVNVPGIADDNVRLNIGRNIKNCVRCLLKHDFCGSKICSEQDAENDYQSMLKISFKI